MTEASVISAWDKSTDEEESIGSSDVINWTKWFL